MGTIAFLAWVALACSSAVGSDPLSTQVVGPADGGMIVPTGQLVRPAGETRAFFGRPTDIALSPSGRQVFVKLTDELMIVDAKSWKVARNLPYPVKEQGSMHGLAVSKDGKRVFVTGSTRYLLEARCNARSDWNWQQPIALAKGKVHATGIALSRDQRTAFVCASITNCLTVVDLESGKIQATVPTGICPFGIVLSPDGGTGVRVQLRRPASPPGRTCRVLGRHAGRGRRSLDLDQWHGHAARPPKP